MPSLAVGEMKRTVPAAVWPGDQMRLRRIAEPDVAELAFRNLGDREHGIERDDLGDEGVHLERLAGCDRNVADDAGNRCADFAAQLLRLGHRERRLRGAQLRLEQALLVGGEHAPVDELQLRVEIDLPLLDERLRFRHLRRPRLVGERGDHVALVDVVAAPDIQGDDRAGRARDCAGAIFRLGAARNHQAARMILDRSFDDGDLEERLRGRRRSFAGCRNRILGASEDARSDPQRRPDHDRDGENAAVHHD